MRDWVTQAACLGEYDLMHDPRQTAVALALCSDCPVQTQCVVDATEWAHQTAGCVVAGQDLHHCRTTPTDLDDVRELRKHVNQLLEGMNA